MRCATRLGRSIALQADPCAIAATTRRETILVGEGAVASCCSAQSALTLGDAQVAHATRRSLRRASPRVGCCVAGRDAGARAPPRRASARAAPRAQAL
eukprot:scaffold21370_cov67-Phaeocystis_antarctica.AAC.5